MKTILVLTDFSINADHAAYYALKLAQKVEASLMLCNISPASYRKSLHVKSGKLFGNYQLPEGDNVEDLSGLAERLNKQLDIEAGFRPEIDHCSRSGMVGDTVNEIAARCNAIMVVISRHSSNELNTLLLKNHTRDIIEKANCPVLIIPYQAKFTEFKKIAFATDLASSSINALRCLSIFAKYFDSKILITHVSPENLNFKEESSIIDRFREQVSAVITYPAIDYREIKSKSVVKGLDWLSDHTDIDMIVLIHRKRNFFQKILEASVTQKIAGYLSMPMLVFPHTNVQRPLPVF
jgi:nucleotide-binding universal stress UspA family protein